MSRERRGKLWLGNTGTGKWKTATTSAGNNVLCPAFPRFILLGNSHSKFRLLLVLIMILAKVASGIKKKTWVSQFPGFLPQGFCAQVFFLFLKRRHLVSFLLV